MKKSIEWKTPKEYQPGWEKEPNSNPAKLPKPRSKYCKKLKGEHVYGEGIQEKWSFSNTLQNWITYYCVGCGKKKTEWIKNASATEI